MATTRSSWRRGGCAWSPSTRTSTSRPRWGRGTATTSTQRSPGPGSTRSWHRQSPRDKTWVNYLFLLWNWAAKWVLLGLTVVANFDLIGWLGPFWETPQTTATANALKRSASIDAKANSKGHQKWRMQGHRILMISLPPCSARRNQSHKFWGLINSFCQNMIRLWFSLP